MAQRASDLEYGHGSALWKYWTRGEGFAKWSGAVHKWTTLRDLLLKAGVPPASADGLTTNIIQAVMPGYMKQAHAKTGHKAGRADMADTKAPHGEAARAESLLPFYRSFPLEDISIRSGGDGRTVEAYAAVFNTPAPVHDEDGDYMEELDPAVFNRAISDAAPQGGRNYWRMGVFYNHAMTLYGTPSELYSMPIGKTLEIKADSRGVLTVTRYHRGEVADQVLEAIREESLPGYSFSGTFRRSTPLIPRGGFRRDRAGNLPSVRRMESTMREYGPTPFPVYAGAAITGMRSEQLLGALAADPDLAMRMFGMLRGGAHGSDSPPPSGAPHPGDSPAEDSRLLARSGRPTRFEIAARRADFELRHPEA
jgi:phage head maturation protease